MRSGTYFSTSKCVCQHHFTCPLPDVRLSSDASAMRGSAVNNVPSTSVSSDFKSCNRGSRAKGCACWANSAIIGRSNSGSKTCRASENEPSDARGTPSFFCTDFNADACDSARVELMIGLKKNNSTRQQYSSKCRSP